MTTPIHPNTRLGYVHLTVTNLARSLAFYQQSLGFQLHRQQDNSAFLGAGREDLLVLTENPQARQTQGTTGLYHFAILVPSRLELAQVLKRVAQTKTKVQGFADHWVSEAMYLPDPDGNGIEIYRDLSRAEWTYTKGELQMATDPLDVESLLAEAMEQPGQWPGLDPATVLGHMHLHVANIPQAEAFYLDVLGFERVTAMPSASFVSAGGYHHHLGLNTWLGAGAPPPPANAVGLRHFVIYLPDETALNEVLARVRQANLALEQTPNGYLVRDPSQNGVMLAVADH